MPQILHNRKFMHCPSFKEAMSQSDQSKRVPAPPFGKEARGPLVVLPSFEGVQKRPIYEDLLDERRSRRKFSAAPLTQAQLAFLLWSSQGIQAMRGDVATLRPAPSGGARHPFETYIAAKSVEGLEPGIYRYMPAENIGEKRCSIERLFDLPDDEKTAEMLVEQKWVTEAPALLYYSCVPYKAEWRYVEHAHRVMLIDLGHVGQNVLLSASALGLGGCCLAAYDQKLCDEVLGLDGLDEYTVYVIAVGA
jgi:SagB-type dehydrogenase family enzyme